MGEFDKLDVAEQGKIRRLDAAIAAAEPVRQARFRALVQNYHLWFQGLTDEQRTALLGTADLGERFQLARKYRLAENAGSKRSGPRLAKIRTGDFGLIGPYEMAYFLRIWAELPPEKRAEVEKKPLDKIPGELRAQGRTLKVRNDPFPPEQEKAYDAKLEADDEFKPLVEPMIRRAEQAARKGEVAKKAETTQKRFEHPFAEFLYFEENRPRPVDPANLARFAESWPDWMRAMTDSLAADDARDYLAIVYRLLYPAPKEMPEPPKPTKGQAAPKKTLTTPRSAADGPAF